MNPLNRLAFPLFLALAAGFWMTPPAHAGEEMEEEEISTDRPDFTETSVVVPRHRLQLESGFTYTDEADGAGHALNFPELLLRYGVGRRTELRLGVPDHVRSRIAGEGGNFFSDLYLGFKQQLGPTGAGWGLALIPAVTIPTGSGAQGSGSVDPEIVLTWSRDLSRKWAVGGIAGFALPREQGERRLTVFPTVSFARSLSDRWGTFFEWAAEFPEGAGDVHLFHHGYTYLVNRTTQADLHVGFGLSRSAPDFFVGAGFSRLF
jgi:hypothetical protein